MKFEIKHLGGRILYTHDGECFSDCVMSAVKSGANLSGANLSGASLSGADLSGAYLSRANLSGADLSGADLSRAYLSRANLCGAYLSGAYLSRANLSGASLSGADLSGAYLSGAYLSGADLSGADLSRANLSGARGLNPLLTTPLYMLKDQPGVIRSYKIVNSEFEGPFNGGIKYEIGKSYEVADADTNENEQCARGINLATLDWCLKEWRDGFHVLIIEHTAADIAAIPIGSDGKYRVFRCTVVGEKTREQLGIAEEPIARLATLAIERGGG